MNEAKAEAGLVLRAAERGWGVTLRVIAILLVMLLGTALVALASGRKITEVAGLLRAIDSYID